MTQQTELLAREDKGTDAARWQACLTELTALTARLIALSESETDTTCVTWLEWLSRDTQRLAAHYAARIEAHELLRQQLLSSLAMEEANGD